jgi:hypothetical protein
MKYIFVVGIEFKKYKRPANIRITAGDSLIDEFSLHESISGVDYSVDKMLEGIYKTHYQKMKRYPMKKVYKGYPMNPPYQGPIDPLYVENFWSMHTIPRYYKVYEIDDIHLARSLRIQVANSHNNYTNGFMSKYSSVRFPLLSLFPKDFAMNNCEKLMDRILKIDSIDYDKMYYYLEKHKRPPEDFWGKLWQTWPNITYIDVKYNDKFNKSGLKKTDSWLGGDFVVDLKIKKKHGIKFLSAEKMQTLGLWDTTAPVLSYHLASNIKLLNIYNEDQRSNNTED